MALRDSSATLRKEHLEILRLANSLEEALALASHEDFSARQKGLADLRALHHGLVGICQHCCSEDGVLESEYHHYLDGENYEQINTQHTRIHRLISNFLKDLPFATADSIAETALPGKELVDQIRQHVAYEEQMLDYIEGLCAHVT
jgi:hypothetical protein